MYCTVSLHVGETIRTVRRTMHSVNVPFTSSNFDEENTSNSNLSPTFRDLRSEYSSEMKRLFVVVLTGGPCGGKSSSLKSVRDTLRGKGYNVMTMPEVPTILMSNGANFPGISVMNLP